MFFPLKVAFRFLKSSKGQTILIALGIAVGVSVQLFIGLLIQGLQTKLIDSTIGNAAHITVLSGTEDGIITDYNAVIAAVQNVQSVTDVSAAYDNPAFVSVNGKTQTMLVRGLTLDKADKLYKLTSGLSSGALPQGDNEVILGKEFAEAASLSVSDSLTLAIPGAGDKNLVVSGIYDLKVASLNKSWLITSIHTAHTLYGGYGASSIEIQIKDVFSSVEEAKAVREAISGIENLKVEEWQTKNAELLSGLNGQSISSIMIQVFVIIAVVLGIASVLAISVMQKSRQLGILKAMGIKDGQASLIFLIQGAFLGIIGAAAGVLVGLSLCFAFVSFVRNPDGSALIPISFNIGFILLSAGIAVAAATLSSLIPAVKSSRLNPIEVIRNG